MALVHADFVEETTTTTGTGTLSLAGATTGHRTFVAAVGNANTCIYAIAASDGTFESGVGTVTDASPDTLARTTLLSSSTGSKLDLPAGTHRVYCTFAAEGGTKAYTAVQSGGVREIWVDAAAQLPKVTNGAAAVSRETATNKINSDLYLFDGAVAQSVQLKASLPSAWNLGTIKCKAYWDVDTGATTGNGVSWSFAAQAAGDGDTIDTAFPTATQVDDIILGVGVVHISAATAAMTVGGTPALGDLIWFQVTRVVSAANDNTSQAAILLGVKVQYTESTTAPSAW
jgi:hypothetical protein